MNSIAILEDFCEYEYVTYYTVKLEVDDVKDPLSETDKFYQTYGVNTHSHFGEFDVILRIIDAMGSYYKGAEACLFRPEDAAEALPPKKFEARSVLGIDVIKDSQLRLYCIRLSSEVVVLLNGGVKTTDAALDCPNVKAYFRFAQSIAKAIDDLIFDGSIEIDFNQIINNTGDPEIILYY